MLMKAVIGKAKRGLAPYRGIASTYIKYIAGSYSNIIGLSLYDVSRMLNPQDTKRD